MNRRIGLLIISLLIGAAAIAGALLCEKTSNKRAERPNEGYTDEQILAMPYFDIIAAKDENRNLPSDIESYSLGDGFVHLYLPGDVPLRNVVVYIRDESGNYVARREFDLTGQVNIGPWEVVAHTHNLPAIYFESDDPELFTSMNESRSRDILCDGNMHACEGSDISSKLGWESSATLQLRGNSSLEYSENKRSYTLRLPKSKDLYGLGDFKSWNLIGNPFDASLLKNTVFLDMAQKCGIDHEPRMQNLNLYVDGKYQGVYTLTTKIKAGKNRIPLKKGDFLYKMDPPRQDQPVYYEAGEWFEGGGAAPVADLVYPENASSEEIEQADALLQKFIDSIENGVSDDLDEIIDIDSLARYYWVQEATMNFDGWERSVYLQYHLSDGKMHAGPVWDMDLTLGHKFDKHGMLFDTPDGWRTRNYGWYKMLFENAEFVRAVNDVYHNGGVREALFGAVSEFETQKELIGEDAYLNFLHYGWSNRELTLDYGEDYDEYCDNMIAFYKDRIEWIDSQMGGTQ